MTENFKLIVITSEKDIAGEAGLINRLFENGLQLLHLRKPARTAEDIAKLIGSISKGFHPKIVLHSHYELLQVFDLKGVHLPENVRQLHDMKELNKIVSTSFHTLEDMLKEGMIFEYVFFSPVFQSISKQEYFPSVEIEKVKNYLQSNESPLRFPVVALGGITDENVLEVKKMNFSGAACIGYIWENSEPVVPFQKLVDSIKAN